MTSAVPSIEPLASDALHSVSWLDELPTEHVFAGSLAVIQTDISTVVPHVSNVRYVQWIDRMAELHSTAIGWPWARLAELNRMWFVARHEFDYLAECFLHDRLLLFTWITGVRRTTSQRAHVIVRPADQTIVCRAHSRWVLVDLNTRRPCRLPADLCHTIQQNRVDDPRASRPADTMDSACMSY